MKNDQILIIGVLVGVLISSQCGRRETRPLQHLNHDGFAPCEKTNHRKDRCDRCYYQRYYRDKDCDCL